MGEINDRIESNSELAGEYREVPECGLSCLMTETAYNKTKNGDFGNCGYTIGREDGLFVAPKDQIDRILEEADGDVNVICRKLGIDPESWISDSDCLMRIDISKEDSEMLDPRYPTGFEGAANENWRAGGKTSELEYETNKETKVRESRETGLGADEYVINMVDINEADSLQEYEVELKTTYQARYNKWHSDAEYGDKTGEAKIKEFEERARRKDKEGNENKDFAKFREEYTKDFVTAYKAKFGKNAEPDNDEKPSGLTIRHAYLQKISDDIEEKYKTK